MEQIGESDLTFYIFIFTCHSFDTHMICHSCYNPLDNLYKWFVYIVYVVYVVCIVCTQIVSGDHQDWMSDHLVNFATNPLCATRAYFPMVHETR
jgi:hypothetical protein